MTSLHALAERLEKATGPDSDLARDLWEALTGECVHRNTHYVELENDERELECSDCGADTYGSNKWRGVLSSLDAAIALCERVLPGCWWSVEREFVYDRGELRERFVGRLRKARDTYLQVLTAATPALALVRAIVRAKLAEEAG